MADDIASLGFAVDSSPLTAAATAADKLWRAARRWNRMSGGLVQRIRSPPRHRLVPARQLSYQQLGT
jgi:hypothetical protein